MKMSLLNEIKNRKSKLKETTTLVTRADGKQYLEHHNTVLENTPISTSHGFVVDPKPDDIPALISEYLYIGSQDCTPIEVLQKYNIKRVLSLGVNSESQGLSHKFVPCLDLPETKIEPILAECLPFIREGVLNKENVLVHCNAGVSRTSLVAIGYLMQYEGMGFDEAYALVKSKRPAIQPNAGFRRQLNCLKMGDIL